MANVAFGKREILGHGEPDQRRARAGRRKRGEAPRDAGLVQAVDHLRHRRSLALVHVVGNVGRQIAVRIAHPRHIRGGCRSDPRLPRGKAGATLLAAVRGGAASGELGAPVTRLAVVAADAVRPAPLAVPPRRERAAGIPAARHPPRECPAPPRGRSRTGATVACRRPVRPASGQGDAARPWRSLRAVRASAG
jgi:hypothetical protein